MMDRIRTGRRRRRSDAADISNAAVRTCDLPQTRGHERPSAHILRLFLRPNDPGHIRITCDELGDRVARERIELLDACDRDLGFDIAVASVFEVVIDLAA